MEMQVNGMVLSMSLWALAFCMWLLVYCYGFWQMVSANQMKKSVAWMWLAFLTVWIMSAPVAVMIKRFM